jgi:hypothetical protein
MWPPWWQEGLESPFCGICRLFDLGFRPLAFWIYPVPEKHLVNTASLQHMRYNEEFWGLEGMKRIDYSGDIAPY